MRELTINCSALTAQQRIDVQNAYSRLGIQLSIHWSDETRPGDPELKGPVMYTNYEISGVGPGNNLSSGYAGNSPRNQTVTYDDIIELASRVVPDRSTLKDGMLFTFLNGSRGYLCNDRIIITEASDPTGEEPGTMINIKDYNERLQHKDLAIYDIFSIVDRGVPYYSPDETIELTDSLSMTVSELESIANSHLYTEESVAMAKYILKINNK